MFYPCGSNSGRRSRPAMSHCSNDEYENTPSRSGHHLVPIRIPPILVVLLVLVVAGDNHPLLGYEGLSLPQFFCPISCCSSFFLKALVSDYYSYIIGVLCIVYLFFCVCWSPLFCLYTFIIFLFLYFTLLGVVVSCLDVV